MDERIGPVQDVDIPADDLTPDEGRILVNLIFKPEALQGRPQPEEIQLILSYIGEILREIEAEEKRLAAKQEPERPSCR